LLHKAKTSYIYKLREYLVTSSAKAQDNNKFGEQWYGGTPAVLSARTRNWNLPICLEKHKEKSKTKTLNNY
jgi:hypothetical protein